MRDGTPVVLLSSRQEDVQKEADSMRLIMNIGTLVLVLIIVGVIIWQVHKRVKALKAPISDEECVSCGSSKVTTTGPGTYRCDECGYEGGSGMAAQQDQKLLDSFAQMAPEERRASGVKDLQEARTLLRAMMGAGVTVGESGSAIGVAQANLAQAKQHLKTASLKLEDSYLAVPMAGAEPGAMASAEAASAVDAQMIGGGVLESMVAMGDLGSMKAEAQHLLQRIDAALTHYTGEAPPA